MNFSNSFFWVNIDFKLYVAGVKVRVYCPVGKSDKGQFTLQNAVKALDLYTK